MGLFNSIGSLFGLGGGQGDYYQAPKLQSEAKDRLDKVNRQDVSGLTQLAAKGGSLADILSMAKGTGDQDTALMALAGAPVGGNALASQQVREDPLLSGLLGKGGSLENALAEEKNLSSRGYSLQPEDYEAYGQGQDQIARLFGQNEANLASALSDRGFGGASSGVAASAFSGLQGNKNEQLAQMQRQIANDRMNNTMQRLQQTRAYTSQLGNMGLNAQGQYFNQNQARQQQLNNQYGNDIGAYQAEQNAAQASQSSKEKNRKAGLEDAIASGIFSGVQGGISSGIGYGMGGMGGAASNAANSKQASKEKSQMGSMW